MSYQLRPAVRQDIPLIVGVAGPTKSGKTYSAHRLARGMAGPDGAVAMLNAEGRRGHQYVGAPFTYLKTDIAPPYSVEQYTVAVREIADQKPDVLIIDSCSHMHDGPGGMLDEHEAIVKRMSRGDESKRDKVSFAAWVKPKQDENAFIYALLSLSFPVILCLRAKEKIKIVNGKPIEMGWQPIVSERVAFETMFTLMLPPHSKGVPDLAISDLRSPFDIMIPPGEQLDEDLGRRLAEWARGGATSSATAASAAAVHAPASPGPSTGKPAVLADIKRELDTLKNNTQRQAVSKQVFGVASWADIEALPLAILQAAVTPAEGADIGRLEAACITAKEAAA